jgi:ribonuclease-3
VSSISSNKNSLVRLQARLNHQFQDLSLLELALTHKSHSRRHNERLEFLGDAVLGYVIADALYRQQPDLAEDSLTLIRAALVRKETLAEVAQTLGLGEFLRLGTGERKSGGRQRASILADALEAIIGAVSLDTGVADAQALVLTLFSDRLQDAGARGARKDPKTQLQELLQARALELPEYEVIETVGSEHRRTFTVSCRVEALSRTTSGRGASRRAAEKAAARAMIEALEAL